MNISENENEIFSELNNRLAENNFHLVVICAGGFVLSHYGMRATQDIDGFFKTNQRINQIIRSVGDYFGINTEDELWLNNSVQNLNAWPPDEICTLLYSFSNLKVLIPPLEYIAGMKLISAREQDVQDVGKILRKTGIDSPEVFLKIVESYGFSHIDESVLLEAFGLAYGMEWLENYYLTHEEEIHRRIRKA